MAKKAGVDIVSEAKDEASDASKGGEEAHGSTEKKEMKTGEELKRGGEKRAKRKSGGKVPGKMAMMRPDRRARGGATSDMNPTTAAGKMSSPSYESKAPYDNGGGSSGKDSRGVYGRD